MIYLEIYLVIIVVVLLLMIKVDMAVKNTKTVDNKKSLSGFESARQVLDDNKLNKYYIVEKKGKTIDYYDSKKKVIKLSSEVFHKTSLYALAVGCYVGMHGSYDKEENSLYKFSSFIQPIFKIIYYCSLFFAVAGMFTGNETSYQMALVLLILVIIYSIILFIIKKNIAYKTYDYLKDNKMFNNKEDDDISNILSNIYFESFTWLITDLLFAFINLINQNK